jgi:hypothetical protein
MSPDKDSGNKDGLLMNFSMKATDILGYKTDMRIVMYIFMTISSSLSTFQLPELFQD